MTTGKHKGPHRLTVEGSDDVHSIVHLMLRHGYDWERDDAAHVHNAGSVEKVLESIGVAAKSYQRAGIVVDADSDVPSRWAAIRNRLTAIGYRVPSTPAAEGLVLRNPGFGPIRGVAHAGQRSCGETRGLPAGSDS